MAETDGRNGGEKNHVKSSYKAGKGIGVRILIAGVAIIVLMLGIAILSKLNMGLEPEVFGISLKALFKVG